MKAYANLIALVLTTLTAISPARAELFRWVDDDGNVTYQDQPPPQEVTTASMVKLPFLGRSTKKQKPPVTLYRTGDCAPCDYAAQFLKRKHVPVREVDVTSDLGNQAELKAKAGNLSVPTLVLKGKVIKGFTPSWLASELDAAGYTTPVKPIHAQEDGEYSPDSADDPMMQRDRADDYPPGYPHRE